MSHFYNFGHSFASARERDATGRIGLSILNLQSTDNNNNTRILFANTSHHIMYDVDEIQCTAADDMESLFCFVLLFHFSMPVVVIRISSHTRQVIIMPELPEVEQFRTLLEPSISQKDTLVLERHVVAGKLPPRKFLSDGDINEINQSKYYVTDVLRKGKLICMVLNTSPSKSESNSNSKNKKKKYLFVHMGMTGFICNKTTQPKLQEVKHTPEQYPPPNAHLKFIVGSYDAYFVDQRKFGSIVLQNSMDKEYDSLAPDAWNDLMLKNSTDVDPIIVQNLIEQTLGIKEVLLDQKRVVSGVGNYLADEILYQIHMHPDQKHLTEQQAHELLKKLHSILETANQCLQSDTEFPEDWLFHYRWTKKRDSAKDAKGRPDQVY